LPHIEIRYVPTNSMEQVVRDFLLVPESEIIRVEGGSEQSKTVIEDTPLPWVRVWDRGNVRVKVDYDQKIHGRFPGFSAIPLDEVGDDFAVTFLGVRCRDRRVCEALNEYLGVRARYVDLFFTSHPVGHPYFFSHWRKIVAENEEGSPYDDLVTATMDAKLSVGFKKASLDLTAVYPENATVNVLPDYDRPAQLLSAASAVLDCSKRMLARGRGNVWTLV